MLTNGESATMLSGTGVKNKPRLHVEACIRSGCIEPLDSLQLSETISSWLYQNFLELSIGETMSDPSTKGLPESIEFIQVADVTGLAVTETAVNLMQVQLIVNIFSFSIEISEDSPRPNDRNHDSPDEVAQTIISHLPCRKFHGIWDSLIYEDNLQFKLLHFLCRMCRLKLPRPALTMARCLATLVALSGRHQDAQVIPWNRVVLLWGPPGTGKTSLCKALAQKISIRLRSQFPRAELVEINAQTIFSKYFGESGRIVGSFFREIENRLGKEPETFIVLLIDEIESLVSARERNIAGNEPRDAMRVVNSFLMALDRLRRFHNVLVFCTSNLIHAMDTAFLDRVDIKFQIPVPCNRARYEILRSTYLELFMAKIIITPELEGLESEDSYSMDENSVPQISEQEQTQSLLPPYGLMKLHFWSDEQSVAKRLWNLAERCKDFSGRTLRRLPAVSLAMYTNEDPCSMHDALDALSQSVEDENKAVFA